MAYKKTLPLPFPLQVMENLSSIMVAIKCPCLLLYFHITPWQSCQNSIYWRIELNRVSSYLTFPLSNDSIFLLIFKNYICRWIKLFAQWLQWYSKCSGSSLNKWRQKKTVGWNRWLFKWESYHLVMSFSSKLTKGPLVLLNSRHCLFKTLLYLNVFSVRFIMATVKSTDRVQGLMDMIDQSRM